MPINNVLLSSVTKSCICNQDILRYTYSSHVLDESNEAMILSIVNSLFDVAEGLR